jgi:hypothetical protein
MVLGDETLCIGVWRWQISSGRFQPRDFTQSAGMADSHSVGGVSGLEVETRPDFNYVLNWFKKRFPPEILRLKRLSKQPS